MATKKEWLQFGQALLIAVGIVLLVIGFTFVALSTGPYVVIAIRGVVNVIGILGLGIILMVTGGVTIYIITRGQ